MAEAEPSANATKTPASGVGAIEADNDQEEDDDSFELLRAKILLSSRYRSQRHIVEAEAVASTSFTIEPPPDSESPVEADDDCDDDESDYQSSTGSIASSVMEFREENGRTYNAYQDGKYYLPCDQLEQDRLDLQHYMFTLTYGGKLYTCDFNKNEKKAHRVLDAGCGTGIWAIDYADEHPEAEILGVDLAAIQPAYIPPNVSFMIDDLEQDWDFDNMFDFIHIRMMATSISDFGALFKNSFE